MSDDLLYIDLQLNGYRGVDFNADDLTVDSCHAACARTCGPTASRECWPRSSPTNWIAWPRGWQGSPPSAGKTRLAAGVIRGIHVEGPFLNPEPGYAGAHPRESIRPADLDAMKRLVDAAEGLVRIVTLAPEHDPGLKVTRWLAEQKIIVSAGHCNPSLDQLRAAIDAGPVDVHPSGQRLPDAPASPRQHHPAGAEPRGPASGSASSATAFTFLTRRWRITCAACRRTGRLSSAMEFRPPAWDRAAIRLGSQTVDVGEDLHRPLARRFAFHRRRGHHAANCRRPARQGRPGRSGHPAIDVDQSLAGAGLAGNRLKFVYCSGAIQSRDLLKNDLSPRHRRLRCTC